MIHGRLSRNGRIAPAAAASALAIAVFVTENLTCADGQASSIYGQWPPLVNTSRKPGERPTDCSNRRC